MSNEIINHFISRKGEPMGLENQSPIQGMRLPVQAWAHEILQKTRDKIVEKFGLLGVNLLNDHDIEEIKDTVAQAAIDELEISYRYSVGSVEEKREIRRKINNEKQNLNEGKERHEVIAYELHM